MVSSLLPIALVAGLAAPQDRGRDGYVARFLAAYDAHRRGDWAAALEGFESCAELRPGSPTSAYYAARSASRAGDEDGALEWLARAVDDGYCDAEVAARDEDLRALRGRVELAELVARMRWLAMQRPPGGSRGAELDWDWDSWHIEFDPAGERFLAGQSDRVYLFDTATGELVADLPACGQHEPVARFSPDGSRIVVASSAGSLSVRDARTGELELEIAGARLDPSARAGFDATGRLLAARRPGARGVAVWDLDTGARLVELDDVDARSSWIAPGGTRLVAYSDSSSGRGTVELWSLEANGRLASYSVDRTYDAVVDFSAGGGRALFRTGSSVLFLDTRTGVRLSLPGGVAGGLALDAAFVGDELVLVHADGVLRAWSMTRWPSAGGTPDRSVTLTGLDEVSSASHAFGWRSTAKLAEDGRYVFGNLRDSRACLWDATTGALRWTSDDGESFFTATASGKILLYGPDPGPAGSVEAGIRRVLQPRAVSLCMPAADRRGRRVALSGGDGLVRMLAVERAEVTTRLASQVIPRYLELSDDGRRLLCAGENAPAELWDVDAERRLARAPWRTDWCYRPRAPIDPTGRLFVSLPEGGGAVVHDLESGDELATLGDESYCAARWSGDGSRLATGTRAGRVRVWDVRSGARIGQEISHEGRVRGLAFHPGSDLLAVAGDGSDVLVWDLLSGERVAALPHANGFRDAEFVHWVEFDPAGEALLTSSGGWWEVRVFHTATWSERWQSGIGGGSPVPHGARFGPDEKTVHLQGIQALVLDVADGSTLFEEVWWDAGWDYRGALPLGDSGRTLLAGPRSVRVIAADWSTLYEYVVFPGDGHLVVGPDLHVAGTSDALAHTLIRFADETLPLECYAALLLDPERARAAVRGVATVEPRLPRAPRLEWSGAMDRFAATESSTIELAARAEDRGGLVGFEVERDGRLVDPALVRSATELSRDGRSGSLVLELASPEEGGEHTFRIRAIGRSGVASRSLLRTVGR